MNYLLGSSQTVISMWHLIPYPTPFLNSPYTPRKNLKLSSKSHTESSRLWCSGHEWNKFVASGADASPVRVGQGLDLFQRTSTQLADTIQESTLALQLHKAQLTSLASVVLQNWQALFLPGRRGDRRTPAFSSVTNAAAVQISLAKWKRRPKS